MTQATATRTVQGGRIASWRQAMTDPQRLAYDRIPEVMDYVGHRSFTSPATAEGLFGEAARQVEVGTWVQFPEVPEDAASAPAKKTTLGSKDEERLFLQYNFARYRLCQLIEAQGRRKSSARARQMVQWYDRVLRTRAKIVRANMALVIAMARRTRIPNVEFNELVSEGNMALLRSVEKFDISRGFKFSTYACRAILKGFNRLATKTGTYRRRFPREYDPELERSDWEVRKHEVQRDDSIDAVREILARNQARLSDVERTVVMERFAIMTRGKGKTLAEVGEMVGLTNERVRQIQNIALAKIRTALDEGYLVA
jgi:RNA polymerase primary sigma factor